MAVVLKYHQEGELAGRVDITTLEERITEKEMEDWMTGSFSHDDPYRTLNYREYEQPHVLFVDLWQSGTPKIRQYLSSAAYNILNRVLSDPNYSGDLTSKASTR